MSRVSLLATLFATVAALGSPALRADTVRASATLALKLSQTGTEKETPGKNGTVIFSASLETFRLGNRDVLEALLADALLPNNSIQGWSVIALWANWPDADPHAGNGYRFFARRGKGASEQLVAIPSSILSLRPVMPAGGYRHVVLDDTLKSGTEKYTVLSEAAFGLQGHIGAPLGVQEGTGRYVRPAGSATLYYLPSATRISLAGLFETPHSERGGVVQGTLSIAAATHVRAAAQSSSAGASVTTRVSGTLSMLNPSLVSFLLSGIDGTFGFDGTLSFSPMSQGTLRLYGPVSLRFSPLPETAESVTLVLIADRAGTLTLGTGETLELEAGDTLPLHTLSLDQLSPLAWVPAPRD